MAERELKVRFTGDTSGLTKSISGAESATSKAAGKISAAGKAIAAGFAVAGAAGVAFAKKSVDTYKNVGGEVAKLKRFTGGTAEEASRLRAGFKLSGIDVDKAATALGRFNKNLVSGKLDGFNTSLAGQRTQAKKVQKAMEELGAAQDKHKDAQAALHDGSKVTEADLKRYAKSTEKVSDVQAKLTALTKGAGGALSELGFKTRDAQGHLLPMSVLLPKVADVFKDMPDGAEKTALAMELFGKAGADLLPFLNKGSDGIAELAKKSDELGTTLSGDDLDAIKESREQSRLWSLAMEGLQIQIGRYVLPVLNALMTWVNEKGIPALHNFGAKVKDWLIPKLEKLSDWWDKEGKPAWDKFTKWIDEEMIPKLKKLGKHLGSDFIDIIKDIAKWAKEHPDWALPITAGLAAIALAIKLFGIEMAATPWGAFILLLVGLAGAFYAAYTTNDEFHDRVDKTIDELSARWHKIYDSFMTDFYEPMKEKGLSFYNDFLMPLWHGFNWLVDYLGQAWANLQETWDYYAQPLGRAFAKIGLSFWQDFCMPIWQGIQAVHGWLVEVGLSFQNDFALPVMRWFKKVGLSFWQDFCMQIWRGILAVHNWLVGVGLSFQNDFALPLVRWFKRVGLSFWQDFCMPIWRGILAVEGWFQGLWNLVQRVAGWIGDKILWIKRQLDKIPSNPIPSWVPVVGGNMVPVPPAAPVPALAAGGIIPGSAWGTLVRAGENNRSEAIIPLSKLPAAGNTYNITVQVAPGSDPVRAGAAVVDTIKAYERANGRGWRTAPA